MAQTIENIKPKFILDHIDDLRKAGIDDSLVIEIERLANRCISRSATGGGEEMRKETVFATNVQRVVL